MDPDGAESLLRDAQQEITKLRAELYTTRKELRDAQQTTIQATAQRDSLAGEVQGIQRELQNAQEQARQAPAIQRALQEAETAKQASDAEVLHLQEWSKAADTASDDPEALSEALQAAESERAKASRAQEAKEKADGDRLRLQRARDELARNLLGLERRAQEAEDELLRIEQESQAEIRSLQSRLADESQSDDRTQVHAEIVEDLDRASLLKELEMEQQRASVLVAALNSAKQERDVAQREAKEAARQLQAALQGNAMPQAGLSKPESSSNLAGLEGDLPAALREVGRLKASRDKLLAQLDSQAAEVERLATENTALTQALLDTRKVCGAWEEQTNDSLAQIDRLKDLLEESALWRSPTKPPRDPQVADAASAGISNHVPGASPLSSEQAAMNADNGVLDHDGALAALESLTEQLVEERARVAKLDLHLRSLSAELIRTSEVTGDLERSALPALAAIEGRLTQILQPT